jgi:sarcosine oxidase subunit gamma
MRDLSPQAAQRRLRISQVRGLRVQVLRLWRPKPALLKRLATALGADLPAEPNATSGERPRMLWMGPGEWCLLGGPAGLDAAVAKACGKELHHLSDVTDGRAIFAIEGPAATDLLSKGCSLDFHPQVFRPGTCAQSLLAQTRVLIERPAAAELFNVIIDRSVLAHVQGWLDFAAAEFLDQDA